MDRTLSLLFLSWCALPARAQTLVGFARLPAATFVPGPTSGQKIEVKDGLVSVPFVDKQPIQGFSALVKISGNEFWALEDNGFGSKANSADSLLRLVRVRITFKTRGESESEGGGAVQIVSSLILADPHRRAGFEIVREDRLLTGADFDPESLVVARDGTFWMGDEFGPFLLHFDPTGALLEAPFPDKGVASPDDPLKRPANIKSSRGFEGLAAWPNGLFLFGMLEGALDGEDPQRLPLYQFDLNSGDATFHTFPDWAKRSFYPLEAPATGEKPHSVGEIACYGDSKFLAVERDSTEGDAAVFKRVYAWNLRDGSKKLVADLLVIADPNGLAGARNATYRMQFQTIESVVVLDKRHLLLCNDNNFPFGRGRGAVEATEFALIELPAPLP